MTEKTCGEALMQLLKGYGVTTVFGRVIVKSGVQALNQAAT